MKNISAALKAHMALGSTSMATCWKATLTNGTIVTATSHDRDILFDGLTYLSVAAYTPTDVESGADLAPDNLELEGFLASPHITAADIHSGIWDYAAVEIFEVNYKDLTMGRNRVREGTLGEVKGGKASFRAELRGLTQAYSRRIVRLIQKECDADLGDDRCKIDLTPFTVVGSIDFATSGRVLADADRTEVANWFAGGKITFTSGDNVGLSMEVKKSTATGSIELHQAMPFPVALGDTYSMYAGCQKRKCQDCIGKFNNLVNFRGFSMLPGSRVYAGPGGSSSTTTPCTVVPSVPGSGSGGLDVTGTASYSYDAALNSVVVTATGSYRGPVVGTISDGTDSGDFYGIATSDGTTTTIVGTTSNTAIVGAVTGTAAAATAAQVAAHYSYDRTQDFLPPQSTTYSSAQASNSGTVTVDGFTLSYSSEITYSYRTVVAPLLTWSGAPLDGQWIDIAYSPALSKFVSINHTPGFFGYADVATSTDGLNWTGHSDTSLSGFYLSKVIWEPNAAQFIAYVHPDTPGGTVILDVTRDYNIRTSHDGVTWDDVVGSPDIYVGDIVYSADLAKWVLVESTPMRGQTVIRAGTSTDGLAWTWHAIAGADTYSSASGLCWSPALSLFVAVIDGRGPASRVATSPDGITWTMRDSPAGNWKSVAWSPTLGMFAAVGLASGPLEVHNNANAIMTSQDGITWTLRSDGHVRYELDSVMWAASEFLATGRTGVPGLGTYAVTSTDGVTWLQQAGASHRKLIEVGGSCVSVNGATDGALGANFTAYWPTRREVLTYSVPV